MHEEYLGMLSAYAALTGVSFDPVRVRRALYRAELDHPGPWEETWLSRLADLGEDLGCRVICRRGTLDMAVSAASPSHPAVIYLSADGVKGRWLLIVESRRNRLRVADPSGTESRWVKRKELEKEFGLHDRLKNYDWAALEPLAAASGHGDDHETDHHEAEHHHGHGRSPLSRLLELTRPEKRELRAVLIFAAGVSVLTLASPLAIEALVTTVAMSLMAQQLMVVSLILLACLGLAAAMRVMQTYLVEIIQRRVFIRIASELAYRLPRVRGDAFDREYGPELLNRFFEVMTVQKVGAMLLLDGISIVLQSVIGLTVLAFYHPYLLSFDLVMIGTMVFIVFLLGRGGVTTSIHESHAKYALASQLQELARVLPAYKIEGGHELAYERVDTLARRFLTARRAHFAVILRQAIFANGFQAVASASLLGLGGWLVIEGQLTLGQLVAAELIVAMVSGSFTKLGKHLEGWYDLMTAVEKLGRLMDLPLEREGGETFHAKKGTGATGSTLRFVDVAYSYGENTPEILRGVDFDVSAGERVAILGSSGSGKSTLADLIRGLRSPTRGLIEIDGAGVRDTNLESLRREMAVVKGVEIIEGTIIDNVRLGRSWITANEMREALSAVGLWDELSRLPDGLHTRLSAHGAPLSKGQASRLMLARAIVSRPRLLILDETLDGLDLDSRQRVMQSLFDKTLSGAMTLLIVTHDEAVARRCDQAVLIVDGKAEHSRQLNSMHELSDWLEELRSCRSV